jgi:hypothetical protein
MTQYEITNKLHDTVQNKAKEFGKVVEIKGDYYWASYFSPGRDGGVESNEYEIVHVLEFDGQDPKTDLVVYHQEFLAIQETQIKQILIAFQKELGENLEYKKYLSKIDDAITYDRGYCLDRDECVSPPKQSHAEALYQRFCCGFPKSQFELDPVAVLTELDEIISKLEK